MSAGKNRTPLWKTLKELFAEGGLPSVFVEGLGWSQGNLPVAKVSVGHEVFSLSPIAELKNYWIIEIYGDDIPTPKEQSAIDRKVAELYPERILVFSDGNAHHWRWPRETPSGGVSFETVTVSGSSLPSFLAQRLVGLAFDIADFRAGITLVDVRNRVRGKFDAAKVTKKFFDAFKVQRTNLAESIVGLDSEEEQSSYSTLLLNRLMLLYFLQKREFLNGDPNYLENCLVGMKDLKGDHQFYSFYRDVLLPMFFERLASHRQTELEPEIEKLLGDVPYINGGIYEPSELEKTHGDSLNVPDESFERIFQFFGAFNWHLDTRPSGSENEINPEVIGYIFEQYINYTAGGRKDNGAYYTKEDVTGYMVGGTLIPRVLDYLVELAIPFTHMVAANPTRYIHSDMLHGFDAESGQWLEAPNHLVEVWEADPVHWQALDEAGVNSEINLPGETWVEAFYRRERVGNLISELESGLIQDVNDLISYNLNSRLLLTDAIDGISDPRLAVELWKRVTALTVLDPTCGSGAFLFAAMEALEDIYHHLIDVMKSEALAFSEAAGIIREITSHPNDRYFVRKSIALNNLYGTDIMPDAIETAQLRIFLALVSCLETREEMEPLPDLDFNLKTGNLLVGLRLPSDVDDVERFDTDLLASLAIQDLRPGIKTYMAAYRGFIDASKTQDERVASEKKRELQKLGVQLRAVADEVFTKLRTDGASPAHEHSQDSNAFHWFVEFPEVIQSGGFDVVVGNPPYIRKAHLDKETLHAISQMKTSRCPDVYAACFERSLMLLSPYGRHSFIVPLNLAFSERFGSLRELIRNRESDEWWSSYGKRPAKLFEGAHLISNITIIGPQSDGGRVFATRHNIFGLMSRGHLFSCLEYSPQVSRGRETILRSGPLVDLANILKPGDALEEAVGSTSVYLRPTGLYWFPVLPSLPASYDSGRKVVEPYDQGLQELQLSDDEWKPLVVAALGGKLGYFWWSSVGDDFHTHAKESKAVRALLLQLSQDPREDQELRDLLEDLWAGITEAVILVSHNGFRVNIRWNQLRSFTDRIDRLIMQKLGIDYFWRDLNVWYRQVMRAGGVSSGDQSLSREEAIEMLDVGKI